jgi:hypothetical protein
VHQARDRVDDVGEGGARAPRPGLPEARDRTIDEIRLQSAQRRVVAPQARHDPGHEVLHDHVGLRRQVLHDRLPLGPREVDADALLAGVHPGEVGALVGPAGLELQIVAPHVVALALALDLDDAGAQIAEQARAVGSGQDAGQIQDGDAGQRQIFGLHESVAEVYGADKARVKPA